MLNRFSRALLGALTFAFSPILCTPAHAATSEAYPEFADIFGSAGTVYVVRMPVALPNGSTIYKDVTIQLRADANGNLSWGTSVPIQAVSPPLDTSNITAGSYIYPLNPGFALVINGPASIGNGVGKWTIVVAPGKANPCGSPATFYTGNLARVPIAARLKAANITDTEYSYGVLGFGAGGGCGGQFVSGNLIGVSQVGNQVQIALFTTATGRDQNVPVNTVEFVR